MSATTNIFSFLILRLILRESDLSEVESRFLLRSLSLSLSLYELYFRCWLSLSVPTHCCQRQFIRLSFGLCGYFENCKLVSSSGCSGHTIGTTSGVHCAHHSRNSANCHQFTPWHYFWPRPAPTLKMDGNERLVLGSLEV